MSEPISFASGMLALATFTGQSIITLYQTVKSFRTHPKQLRDLHEELGDLTVVVHSLTERISATPDVDFSALERPLLRCGKACKEFDEEITKCSARSGENRTSFRDWAKLRYMGDGIDGFRRLLSGYKSTIIVVLTDANLRVSAATAESLGEYRNLIESVTSDLETHLSSIDEKIEKIFQHTVTRSDSDAVELQRMEEERLSAQKCLQICAQLSDHISQIELTSEPRGSSPGSMEPNEPEKLTASGMQGCKQRLALTVEKLEKHMVDRIDQMIAKSREATTSDESLADLARLREEWETTRQSIHICSKAETHLKEKVSNIGNYATGDAVQFMVSTDRTVINGTNRGLGWRTRQFGGHFDNESLQKLAGAFSNISLLNTGSEGLFPNRSAPSVPNEGMERSSSPEIERRYGPGHKVSSWTSAGASMPPADSAGSGSSSSPKR